MSRSLASWGLLCGSVAVACQSHGPASPASAAASSVALPASADSRDAGATATPTNPPAPAPWPDAVSPWTPAPERAEVVGNAADGRVLLLMTRAPTTYYAVLDPQTTCIEEVHDFAALRSVRPLQSTEGGAPSPATTGPDRAARFDTDPVRRDLARLRALALRFGVHTLDDVAFGAADGDVVLADSTFFFSTKDRGDVVANGTHLFATRNGALADLDVGPGFSPSASPDGRLVAFAASGSSDRFKLHLLDTATRKVTRVDAVELRPGIAPEAGMRWSATGDVLFYPYRDAKSGHECLGAIDTKSLRTKSLECFGENASFAG
jgi:hypothetical protein